MPSSGRRRRAIALFLIFAFAASLVRLSRRDFGLLPFLAPLDFHGTSPNFFACAGGAVPRILLQGSDRTVLLRENRFGIGRWAFDL